MVVRKYTPVDDDIDQQVAFVQVAIALDAAGAIAQKKDDAENLTQIAMVWLEMAARLGVIEAEGEDTEDTESSEDYPKPGVGFDGMAQVRRNKDRSNDERTDRRN